MEFVQRMLDAGKDHFFLLGPRGNIGGFTRFLQAMSFSQASVLNLANVSREVQVSRKTVEGIKPRGWPIVSSQSNSLSG
jgi:hypothetical protein